MFDSSTDKKVVLQPYREIPREALFNITDAKQDSVIPNRYWFNYPEEWTNQLDKDAIVGIRSIYLTKANRYIKFNLRIVLTIDTSLNPSIEPTEDPFNQPPAELDSITVNFSEVFDGSKDFRDMVNTFESKWKAAIAGISSSYEWKDNDIRFWFDSNQCTGCKFNIGRTANRTTTYTDYLGNEVSTLDYHDETSGYCYKFVISYIPLSDSAKSIIYPEFITGGNVLTFSIWSCYQCYIKSSISEETHDSFLGHTRESTYSPLKYYRLKTKNNRFWIELYDTRNHRCPVVFPKDKLDDLFIEAILCFNSAGMI